MSTIRSDPDDIFIVHVVAIGLARTGSYIFRRYSYDVFLTYGNHTSKPIWQC